MGYYYVYIYDYFNKQTYYSYVHLCVESAYKKPTKRLRKKKQVNIPALNIDTR